MPWADSVSLNLIKYCLHDPCAFEPKQDVVRSNQFIILTHWEYLLLLCNTTGIIPLVLSNLTNKETSKSKRWKRTWIVYLFDSIIIICYIL